MTRLGTFAGQSDFRTWLYRIAVNHLLNVRKSEMEERGMTFAGMGASLDEVKDEDLPDQRALPVETAIFVEEAKLGCITAILMCFDRRQRLAFILGEVCAEAMEVTADNFRQLLSRARRDLYEFMKGKCGLVNQANPCRCARKAASFVRNGWLDADRLQFSKDRIATVKAVAPDRLDELQELDRRHGALYREQPFLSGPDLGGRLREVLTQSGFAAN